MSENDLDRRFMAALRDKGLRDKTIELLLLAPPHFNFFGLLVKDMDTFGLSIADQVEEEADSVGRP